MPPYNNALTQRPANMLAYQGSINPVPRNEYLGALADFLAQSYSPERTQQMQGTARFLSLPAISETLDRLSYDEPLTTGAGGLGGTTRIRPEVLEASMAVAPLAQPVTMATLQAARLARQAALAGGHAGERYAERVIPQMMERGGLPAQLLSDLGRGTIRPMDVLRESRKTAPTALPQENALKLAQQRAALPVDQGGLGLPKENTPEMRAQAMGIDVETSYIHSTSNPFTKINEDGKFSGIFTLPNYSANYGTLNMPLVVRGEIATSDDLRRLVKRPTKKMQMAIDERIPENVDVADATVEMQKLRNELARKYGFSGVKVSDEFGQDTTALVSPENIRSRFAAFDPFRRSAAIAASMGVAAPDLLAEEKNKLRQGR